MISKKNPSIPEFIEEKNADPFTLLEFFQYISYILVRSYDSI